MSTTAIQKQLQTLRNSSAELYLAMVVSPDGLVIAYEGKVKEPDLFGAYFYELNRVTGTILAEFNLAGVEEIYIRSESGAVTLLPIFDKGYLACLSSVNLNAGKIQLLAWRHLREIYNSL